MFGFQGWRKNRRLHDPRARRDRGEHTEAPAERGPCRFDGVGGCLQIQIYERKIQHSREVAGICCGSSASLPTRCYQFRGIGGS
jgi:hypothetical protein